MSNSKVTQVIRLLGELNLSEDPKRQLLDLKSTLFTLPATGMEGLHTNVQLDPLFDSFNSSDGEQVELAVEVMGHLLPHVSPQEVVERFNGELLRGLQHPHEKVRSLVLKQVLQCAETEAGVASVRSHHNLLIAVIRSLGDKSLGVVKVGNNTLVALCRQNNGLNAVFSNESITVLEEVMARSDSCRFNVYEFIVCVCLLGETALSVASNSGLLDRLIAEVTTGDILTQLNALELLTPLALNPGGMSLLDRGGVIAKLQYLLSLAETDPMAALLMPGLIKFFGNVGAVRPWQLVEQYGSVLVLVLKLAAGSLNLGDPTLQSVAIQTVAHIGSSHDGKLALSKCRSEMDGVMEVLGSTLRTGRSEQRVAALEALTQLLTLQESNMSEEVARLLETWWAGLDGVNMEKVMEVTQQPFSDLHCAALGLINTLTNLPWGQHLIHNEPGMVEYLLDRSTESDKAGKEAKWTVVESLVKSPSSPHVFEEEQLTRLERYYRQGPFYVEAQVEVALEGHN
ncbi:hypothetical protein Pmani_003981 [Petrolisthes manimaculis]|uniref:26S proteasome non-ATPase regulatory subunit 5 n=1 Tax=Petrolisthes manimaculis TaxID=1843537 RepID=A0AAE1QF81_9EUCA|nr:hypothetical protein Pmani_003981 [Petrolisthes manimaculis]